MFNIAKKLGWETFLDSVKFTWDSTFVDALGPRDPIEIKPKSNTGKCIYIYKIYVGIAIFHILLICNRVMPLMDVRILVLLNIFRTNGQNLTRLYKCIYIDKICVNRSFTCYLLQICNKVMALVWQQDFVSVQYLEDKWI